MMSNRRNSGRAGHAWRFSAVLVLAFGAVLSSGFFSAEGFVPPKFSLPGSGSRHSLGQGARVPVLVELFTSEGCAICPPADEVLHGLEAKQSIPGVEVIALEMHVDYWNGQGWRDPFALRQFTNRQNDYIRMFHLDNLYTPQMVIAGQSQVLGSDEADVRKQILHAAKDPQASVEISFQSASIAAVRVARLPSIANESEVWMAIAENNLESAVAGGENSGRTLKHTGVVRSLVMLGRVEPGEPTVYSMHLRFNPRWKRDDLTYVVFVQERLSRKIWGVSSVTP